MPISSIQDHPELDAGEDLQTVSSWKIILLDPAREFVFDQPHSDRPPAVGSEYWFYDDELRGLKTKVLSVVDNHEGRDVVITVRQINE